MARGRGKIHDGRKIYEEKHIFKRAGRSCYVEPRAEEEQQKTSIKEMETREKGKVEQLN